MKVKSYGHACVEVKINGRTILFDPFITPNELASHIDVRSLDPDYILISHGHEDHVADAVEIAKKSEAQVISNFEIVNWFADQGIKNAHPLNHGGGVDLDFGRVKYVNAIHSSVLPDGTYGGNPGGFVVTSNEGNFYYAGDTALTQDMKLIPEFARLNFAFLPIGDNFTMDVEDAVKASDLICCNRIVGMHYDTFPYIRIDKVDAKIRFKKAHKELILIDIGEDQDL